MMKPNKQKMSQILILMETSSMMILSSVRMKTVQELNQIDCLQCVKSPSQHSELYINMRIHTGEKI